MHRQLPVIDFQIVTKFRPQFELLKLLFPYDHFSPIGLSRLNEIYELAEAKWEENLQRLSGTKVKYLLIGEAPPWTEAGKGIRYFYSTCDGAWVNRIWKAFFDNQKPNDPEHALAEFARKDLLLVDSLPFAVNYSRRRGKRYQQLVKSCSPFLLQKLSDRRIDWADEVRVALAFKINGRAVIQGFPDGIVLRTGQRIHLSEDLICADGSGYTSPRKLREAFNLS